MTEKTTKSPPAEELLTFTAGRIPDNDAGVKAIVDLANKATALSYKDFETKGLGDGLPEKVPFIFDHRPGHGWVDIKSYVEKFRLFPARRTGTAKVTTLQTFIDLVNRHKSEHSAIFAATAWPKPALTGVLDYHEKDKGNPAHLQHRVVYDFPLTEEFKVWIANNGKPMEQAEFALFLEEHAAELSSPFDGEKAHYENLFKERIAAPMELVSLSRNLEVHVGQKFKRAERLQTGERTVEFVEEHQNAKGEKVDIPGAFMLSVPAFMDGEPVRIAARLRYRAAGGTISWFYQLYRWDMELRNRVKNDLQQATKETSLPAFEGTPEA